MRKVMIKTTFPMAEKVRLVRDKLILLMTGINLGLVMWIDRRRVIVHIDVDHAHPDRHAHLAPGHHVKHVHQGLKEIPINTDQGMGIEGHREAVVNTTQTKWEDTLVVQAIQGETVVVDLTLHQEGPLLSLKTMMTSHSSMLMDFQGMSGMML